MGPPVAPPRNEPGQPAAGPCVDESLPCAGARSDFRHPIDGRIVIVAGEASGDLLAAQLIASVRQRAPAVRFAGVAGPRMIAEGCEAWAAQERLAVRGYVEVLRHLPELVRLRRALRRRALAERADLFIGVDAPDFNLGLARTLHRRGMRTVHFVSPSIWAWRPERLRTIGESVDRMLTLFPFEASLYLQAGIPATFVGHPTAAQAPVRRDPQRARSRLQMDPLAPLVVLMPGSRVSELEHHAALFLQAAALLHRRFPKLGFVAPFVNGETRAIFEAKLYDLGLESLPITMLYGHSDLALEAADVGLIASGTATLEAMLFQCPHVIVYHVSAATAWLVRRRLSTRWIGLPNIIAREFLAAEILQEDATPENAALALGNLYGELPTRLALEARFAELSGSLRADTGRLLGDAVLGELAKARR